MTYQETINFLFDSLPVWEQKGAGAYKPGLERIREFASLTGDPQDGFRSIHVAGTNGKGSTSHMLAAVLQSAGYRTGLFTSPHLVDFRERIRVDGKMIPRQAVVEFTGQRRDGMVRTGLTFFEMATAMAFWWFARSGCDVAVIETGLGGRLDSTNIVTPAVSVITNIGLEHTRYLGGTIAEIAGEKAGIIKPGVPVVIGETCPESESVFLTRAAELGSPIVFANKLPPVKTGGRQSDMKSRAESDGNRATESASRIIFAGNNFQLDLAGDYQQKNLATVLATVGVLRRTFTIDEAALREGLAHTAALTGLRGRWEVSGTAPLVVYDTAHNAHGLAETVSQIARQRYGRLYMVLGFAGDKDLDAIVPLLPRDAHYILTQASGPRAMPAEELAERLVDSGKWNRLQTGSHRACPHGRGATEENSRLSTLEVVIPVPAAVDKALSLASPDDMVYIGGSNFVVGEALPHAEC